MNNILVTGGAGYIGSHVCESLIKNKKKVFIVDNLSSGSKKLINKKAIFYKINILDTKKIKNLIIKKKNRLNYTFSRQSNYWRRRKVS